MSEPLHSNGFEQSPKNRQRFGDWVRKHTPISEEYDDKVSEATASSFSVTPGSLDIPATTIKTYNGAGRLQIEFYGRSGIGDEALMTLLQDDGGDVSLYVNKPMQISVSDGYLSMFMDKLDALEGAGDISPLTADIN